LRSSALYRIGHLTLRSGRQLLDGDAPVTLGRKALEILSVLAEADGELVTKDELMAAVWSDIVVEENAIQVHIAALRKALGNEARALITVHGLGYRLEARQARSQVSRTVAGPAHASAPLVAVLAFESRSTDPELAYFAEGVAEEILQSVSRIEGVRAIARTSSFQLSGEARRTSSVASMLGATHILDGSVRRERDRLRISTQLIDTHTETVLWADNFDGALVDVFAFQDAIAHAVARALRSQIVDKPHRRPVDPQAYDLLLQGRRLESVADQRTQSIAHFENALAIAPDFPDALASLALCLAVSARWDDVEEPLVLRNKALARAKEALALDPYSEVAILALEVMEPAGNYERREELTQQALALAPNSSECLFFRSFQNYAVGRVAEAYDCAVRGWRIDPFNQRTVANYANLLFEMGWQDESYATFKLARKRWPDYWWFLFDPLLHASFSGNWTEVDALLQEPKVDRPEIRIATTTAAVLREPTERRRHSALANARTRFATLGRTEPSQLMFLYRLGFADEAFELVKQSDFSVLFDPEGKPKDMVGFTSGIIFSKANRAMRNDPRFVGLCEKLGLCTYWRNTGRWPDCADETPYDFRSAVADAPERV
jgi:TolB-like protein